MLPITMPITTRMITDATCILLDDWHWTAQHGGDLWRQLCSSLGLSRDDDESTVMKYSVAGSSCKPDLHPTPSQQWCTLAFTHD